MIENEMNATTKTTVKYNHILAQDYLVEENWYGQPVWAKAGQLMRVTKTPCLYKEYLWDRLDHGRLIPGDLIKVVKVTTTTTVTETTEDVVWE
jgi:hypothetical protein